MSDALYEAMREKWTGFLDEQTLDIFLDDKESVMDQYDDLAHDFCEKHGYSEKTEEFVFHGQWFDTFVDIYYKALEEDGFEGVEEDIS